MSECLIYILFNYKGWKKFYILNNYLLSKSKFDILFKLKSKISYLLFICIFYIYLDN